MKSTQGLVLIAVIVALRQQRVAAQWNAPWRPSYSVNASSYSVAGNILYINLTYTNWQGYFNNTWTLPSGKPATSTSLVANEQPSCLAHVHEQQSDGRSPATQAQQCWTQATVASGQSMGLSL